MSNKAQVVKILREWSADFRQTGNDSEADFWGANATALEMSAPNVEMMGEGVDHLRRVLDARALPFPREIMATMPYEQRAALLEIRKEAKVVKAFYDELLDR